MTPAPTPPLPTPTSPISIGLGPQHVYIAQATPTPHGSVLFVTTSLADQDAFWVAPWSGLIYSVVVGLVVGLVLFFVTRWTDNRRFTRLCKGQLALFKERLIGAFMQPWPVGAPLPTEALEPLVTIGRNTREVVAIIQDHYPISEWQEALKGEAAFFKALRDVQKTYTAFTGVATHYDVTLAQATQKYIRNVRARKANEELKAFARDKASFTQGIKTYCQGLALRR